MYDDSEIAFCLNVCLWFIYIHVTEETHRDKFSLLDTDFRKN